MKHLLDNWRSQPRRAEDPPDESDTVPRLVSRSKAQQIAYERLSGMSLEDLLDYIEANLGGVGRNIRNWRSTRDPAQIYEAQLASEIQLVATEVLVKRIPQ